MPTAKALFTIGSDPEFGLADDNGIVPAEKIFPPAEQPLKLSNGGAAFYDNINVEVNIPPATNVEQWLHNLTETLQLMHRHLPADTRVYTYASMDVPEELIQSHPGTQEFGCRPDYNAYTMRQNDPPNPKEYPTLRSAGGHIHIGYADNADVKKLLTSHEGRISLVKWLDTILYTELGGDNTTRERYRRLLYGRPGDHRPKPYGVEYRVLSANWLATPDLARLTYHLTEAAIRLALTERCPYTSPPGRTKKAPVHSQCQISETWKLRNTA